MNPKIHTVLAFVAGLLCLLYVPLTAVVGRVSPRLAGALFMDSILFVGLLALVCLCMGLDRVYNYFFHGDTPHERRSASTGVDLVLSIIALSLGLAGVLILGITWQARTS